MAEFFQEILQDVLDNPDEPVVWHKEDFFFSAFYNDLPRLQQFLHSPDFSDWDFNVNQVYDLDIIEGGSKSWTALFGASAKGNHEAVKILLQQKDIDVNLAEKEDNISPLLVAATEGHPRVVNLLLKHPNIRINQTGYSFLATPLYFAAQRGHIANVKLLLDCKGVAVNQNTTERYSPLLIAIENGHTEIVKLLLKHPDIDVKQGSLDDSSPLYFASEFRRTDIVKLLCACPEVDVNKPNKLGQTALHVACENSDYKTVKVLLKHPDIDPTLVATAKWSGKKFDPLYATKLRNFYSDDQTPKAQMKVERRIEKSVRKAEKKKCRVCSEKGSFKCGRCKFVYYCSKECQKKHWKGGHKQDCSGPAA